MSCSSKYCSCSRDDCMKPSKPKPSYETEIKRPLKKQIRELKLEIKRLESELSDCCCGRNGASWDYDLDEEDCD